MCLGCGDGSTTLHDLRTPLQLPIDLLPPAVRDPGIDHRILDVHVPQVVLHILNALACFQQVRGNGVAQLQLKIYGPLR